MGNSLLGNVKEGGGDILGVDGKFSGITKEKEGKGKMEEGENETLTKNAIAGKFETLGMTR